MIINGYSKSMVLQIHKMGEVNQKIPWRLSEDNNSQGTPIHRNGYWIDPEGSKRLVEQLHRAPSADTVDGQYDHETQHDIDSSNIGTIVDDWLTS
jgi:murein tripeptide amidase MpaA